MKQEPTRGSFLRGMTTLGASVLTLGRSYRRFEWRTEEDERHTARTPDGWNLALYRYCAVGKRQPFPVICSHGMAGSHLIFDLHPDYSLARYLATQGFDTWLVDLRGRGDSWPDNGPDATLQWNFDDFVERDVPTAVERVCGITHSEEVSWIGMEMSGQAIYAASILGTTNNVRGAVTCGSPVLTPPTALVPGITSAPKGRRNRRVPSRRCH